MPEPAFTRLASLAAWHRYQADPYSLWITRSTRRRHLGAADQYEQMLANRAAADGVCLTIDPALPVHAISRWLRSRNYRYLATAGTVGVIAQRGEEPPLVARVGDTLHWNGQKINVEEGA